MGSLLLVYIAAVDFLYPQFPRLRACSEAQRVPGTHISSTQFATSFGEWNQTTIRIEEFLKVMQYEFRKREEVVAFTLCMRTLVALSGSPNPNIAKK